MAKVAGKNKTKKPIVMRYAQNWIAYVYMLLMLGGFPLFFRNNYINIMESKWLWFMISTLAIAAALIICFIVKFASGDFKKPAYQLKKEENEPKPPFIEKLKSFLPWPDRFLIVFLIGLLLSWAATSEIDYFVEAWDGSEGKMAGVFFYLMLILAYIIVSRFVVFEGSIVTVYLWVNLAVFGLACLNHFMIDPLDMYSNLIEEQYWMFCSTMGNINVLAGYFCIFVPVTIGCFIYARDGWALFGYGTIMTVCFMGVIAANGDSSVLGVLGSFVFLLFFSFDNYKKLARYFMAIALFFSGAAYIGSLDIKNAETVKERLETLPSFISNSPVNRAAMIVCWILAIVCYVLHHKKVRTDILKIVKYILIAIVAAAIICALGVFGYYSLVDTEKDLGQWATYLRFSDNWGSSRGFTWTRVMNLFRDVYEPYQKVFGYGPDLMVVPLHGYYHDEIFAKMGAYLVDAHSEFFQTLGTLGIVGVITYFGFQIAAFIRLMKNRHINPFLISIAAGIIGYNIQGALSSPQTFSTPMLFIFIGLGEAIMRNGFIEPED